LSKTELLKIVEDFSDAVFQRGDVLMKQDDDDDSVYVLARGTVRVEIETQLGEKIELDELGMGSVFGEIAWALKSKRGASIIATSPGLLFTISGQKLREIAERETDLADRLWDTCGRRLSENMLANQVEHASKSRRQIRDIVHSMELFGVQPTRKDLEFRTKAHVVLLQGNAFQVSQRTGETRIVEAPDMVRPMGDTGDFYSVKFSNNAKFMCEMTFVTTRKTLLKAKLRMQQNQGGGNMVEELNEKMDNINLANAINHNLVNTDNIESKGRGSNAQNNKFLKTGVEYNNSGKKTKTESEIEEARSEIDTAMKEAIERAKDQKKEVKDIRRRRSSGNLASFLQSHVEEGSAEEEGMGGVEMGKRQGEKSPAQQMKEAMEERGRRVSTGMDGIICKPVSILAVVNQEEENGEIESSMRKSSLISRRYQEPNLMSKTNKAKYAVSPETSPKSLN